MKGSTKASWVDNHGVKINYLDSESNNQLTPLVFVPGMLSSAQDHIEDMDAMAPRRCLSLSLRGRGESDTPATGYSLDDHVSDIEAVMQRVQLDHYAIFAFSVGVPYAIEYAAIHGKSIAGLIIGDYPALLKRIPETWVSDVIKDFGEDQAQFARAIQRESRSCDLWDRLGKYNFPLLVLHGCKEGSLLKAEHIERYEKHSRNIEVIAFEESDHYLWEPDHERVIDILKNFMEMCDKRYINNPQSNQE
ncbi:MAG: alpha/beta hydrolase [candidate division WOR-3 bacterium]|jgi:pimeloyl-ACP methyl ester carboxylesterase